MSANGMNVHESERVLKYCGGIQSITVDLEINLHPNLTGENYHIL